MGGNLIAEIRESVTAAVPANVFGTFEWPCKLPSSGKSATPFSEGTLMT